MHELPVDLIKASEQWAAARALERSLMATLQREMRIAAANGLSEERIAEYAGVARLTVRRALGKTSRSKITPEVDPQPTAEWDYIMKAEPSAAAIFDN